MPSGTPPARVPWGARSTSGWSSPDGSGEFHSSRLSRPARTRPETSASMASSIRALCLSLPRCMEREYPDLPGLLRPALGRVLVGLLVHGAQVVLLDRADRGVG